MGRDNNVVCPGGDWGGGSWVQPLSFSSSVQFSSALQVGSAQLRSALQGHVAATEGADHNFKIWLKSRGEHEACSTLRIGQSSHGRGLFALRTILAGECILRISTELVITPDKLHHELKDLLQENVSSCARLALLILSEQYFGLASNWAPYMNCLPQFGALHNTEEDVKAHQS
ncbi:hypothetical protein L7F22_058193 [Adiantum nelumboides]|nr:hypothetical protein [Adiantum nelumboides]